SPNIEDVMGKITDTKTHDNHVDFTAEIMTEDSNILIPILSGNVDSVSIEADADSACSVCGKNYIGCLKPCKCSEAHPVIRNVKVERLSIVANPAYKYTKFVPMNFAAAIQNKFLEGEKIMSEKTDEKIVAEEKKEDVSLKAFEDIVEQLKALSAKIDEIGKKFEDKKAEKETEEEKKPEEEEEVEKKKSSKKIASVDKTKSMAVVDTSHDNTPPAEMKLKASKDSNAWMAEILEGRRRMDGGC
ncbi:MAG: hypothetical protein Q8M94_07185, partial [Ignavibacteria bacterium]|nr:hypothetical protein [Ignavibacteria bacterium]